LKKPEEPSQAKAGIHQELETIFPEVLRQNEPFLVLFDKALSTIQAQGPAAAISKFLKEYY
jgi:hypothetical protein